MATPLRKAGRGPDDLAIARGLIERNAQRFAADAKRATAAADLVLTLRRTNTVFQMFTDQYLADSGFSPAQLTIVLGLLNVEGGASTASEICRHISVSMSNVTKLIDGLERMGIVRRATDKADARVTVVTLTKEGRKKAERIAPIHYNSWARALDLSTNELTQLVSLLDRVRMSVVEEPD